MGIKFDLGMDVVCIKPHLVFKYGHTYHINGFGDMRMVSGEYAIGYGIDISEYDYKTKKTNYETYYFSLSEMEEYFITSEEDFKKMVRDRKIDEILGK